LADSRAYYGQIVKGHACQPQDSFFKIAPAGFPEVMGRPVHMIKLTETREITPYLWVHQDEGAVMAGSKKRPSRGKRVRADEKWLWN